MESKTGSGNNTSTWQIFFNSKDFKVIIFEKILVAIVVILVGYLVNNGIEKIKASEAWYAELSKQRIEMAKSLINQSIVARQAHAQVLWIEQNRIDPKDIQLIKALQERNEALHKLWSLTLQAS